MDNLNVQENIQVYAKNKHDNSLKNEKNLISVMLDSNHNNFIFVDDGSRGEFGREIGFRSDLEKELRAGKSLEDYRSQKLNSKKMSEDRAVVPMVLIVVHGGVGTIDTVVKSLKNSTPVLILAGSNGCADLIANAYVRQNDK